MRYTSRRGAASRPSGAASTTALAVAGITVVCALSGFYLGRNVLGEQYLKRGAAKLRRHAAPYVPPAASRPAEPPLVEEPLSLIEPAQREPRAPPQGARDRPPTPARPAPVTLQLGCFLRTENAKLLVQDLRNRGYAPKVVLEKQGRSTLHRVQLGPMPPGRARDLAAELQRQGYEVMVLEAQTDLGGAPPPGGATGP